MGFTREGDLGLGQKGKGNSHRCGRGGGGWRASGEAIPTKEHHTRAALCERAGPTEGDPRQQVWPRFGVVA